VLVVIMLTGCQANRRLPTTELVTYGGMHETIGQKQHHGRVPLVEILDRPHFYGVGAVEELRGEITILDSVAVVTGGAPDGGLHSLPPAGLQATLLAGRSVPEWTTHVVDEAVLGDRLDATIAVAAEGAGLDRTVPFVFVVEGVLTGVRLHVINGACPVRARIRSLALGEDERPFELEAATLEGTVVGVYAEGSVGELTHPATSTHAHLIWEDGRTGQRVTGHLERFGLAPGAVLKLPAVARP
jgi:hypothetical protein